MNTQFVWEDFNHHQLKELRKKYSLEDVVSKGNNEFERQLLLKNWVFDILPLGYNNSNQYNNAIEVLADKENPGGFNCTWYVLVFLQCAIALGWYVRKLGIDTNHELGEEEKRHTIVEIWSSEYHKWYVVDPMFNVHFVIRDISVNALEIRSTLFKTDENVKKIYGTNRNTINFRKYKDRHDTPENYFWFFILLRNNYFVDPNIFNSQSLLWVDAYNSGKTWYVGGVTKGEPKKHPMYDGAFISSSDFDLFYPDMNVNVR
jgi:hypothetical protein